MALLASRLASKGGSIASSRMCETGPFITRWDASLCVSCLLMLLATLCPCASSWRVLGRCTSFVCSKQQIFMVVTDGGCS